MDWQQDVYTYLEVISTGSIDLIRPEQCKYCQNDTMHIHDTYNRTVYVSGGSYLIKIYRFRCPSCKKTISRIPSFVERYHRIGLDIQEEIVVSAEAAEQSMQRIADAYPAPVGPLSLKTVWRWNKKWTSFSKGMETWFWEYALRFSPYLSLPVGTDKPKGQLHWFRRIWQEIRPSTCSMSVLHLLYRNRQSVFQ